MTDIKASITSLSESEAKLACDLTMHTVTAVLPQGIALIKQAKTVWRLDMAAVQQVSSAGVALLIEWLKVAEKDGKTLEIQQLPEHMLSIIEISGLEPLFTPLFRTPA